MSNGAWYVEFHRRQYREMVVSKTFTVNYLKKELAEAEAALQRAKDALIQFSKEHPE